MTDTSIINEALADNRYPDERSEALGTADVGSRYVVAKLLSVPPKFLAISHETGCTMAESECLESLHQFVRAHGMAYEDFSGELQ